MQIGGSDRIERLERRLARLEDILRQLALVLGVHGVDREIDRVEPEPQPVDSAAIADQRSSSSSKRR